MNPIIEKALNNLPSEREARQRVSSSPLPLGSSYAPPQEGPTFSGICESLNKIDALLAEKE